MGRDLARVVTDSRLAIAMTLVAATWTTSGPGWAALFSVVGVLVPLTIVSLTRRVDFVSAAFASSGWQRAVVMCTGVVYGIVLASIAALLHAPAELLGVYVAYMVGMATLGIASAVWDASARVGVIGASAGLAFGVESLVAGVALVLYAIGLAIARVRRDSFSRTVSGVAVTFLAGLLTWFSYVML